MKNLILIASLLVAPYINPNMVRHGQLSEFNSDNKDRVGVIESTKIYEELPSVKLIRKDKLEQGTARYNKLMQTATNNYKKILKAVARDKNLVLIVELGGVKDYPTISVTKECILMI
tara:strand:- start:348 stop:698 length:351 start_codon:yes stop_codon:yes gene_type:complete